MFKGCGTALVTPFLADGSLDEMTLRALVRRQVSEGIDFLVPCGTTGESPTLEHHEHLRVVEITLEEAGGKPVLAGAGGYNTAHVIHLAKELEAMGVQGLLSVTPYYNKPTQAGCIAHYEAIAAATSLPIILYSVQPRTNVNLEPLTVAHLAKIPNIIGIKEASGSLAQVAAIIHHVPADFLVLSGDDAVTLALIGLGGHGVISVVGNQIPGHMTQLANLALQGKWDEARAIQRKFYPLMEINFVEANPQPVKYAMAKMGLMEPNVRLPLVPVSAASTAKIDSVLTHVGLA
jgi:4-hydroxy-tetrahydrodipicolinate synthase